MASKPFREYVFAACADFSSTGDPFEDIDCYKAIFQNAAQHAGRTLRQLASSSPSAQASAIAATARAIHRNDWSALRRAWKTLPSLKGLFAPRGQFVIINDTIGFARLAQTVLLKVASGRPGRAVAQCAPRPRVEALLAKTKLFLPHRRRDSLGAIILADGTIRTDKETMATALADFWGRSFIGTTPDTNDMESFCRNNVDFASPEYFTRPAIGCVHGSIRRGKWSSPGPDGIAAGVWARFATCVSSAFFEATTDLSNGGAVPPNLNASLAVYIPKKGLSTGIHGIQARAAEARPLSLKNILPKSFGAHSHALLCPLSKRGHTTRRGGSSRGGFQVSASWTWTPLVGLSHYYTTLEFLVSTTFLLHFRQSHDLLFYLS